MVLNFKWIGSVGIVFFTGIIFACEVKVLLEENNNPQWKLSAPRGFQVLDGVSEKPLNLRATHHSITVTVRDKKIWVNEHQHTGDSLIIASIKRHAVFNERYYAGYFIIQKKGDSFFLINCLDLESYVFAVLRTESWPGWPLDMHKVMAIVCRTYVLFQIAESSKKNLCYHVKNTNEHQTYAGAHTCPIIAQAVKETESIYIAYKKKPILAMFDCCCGGIIPALIENGVSFVQSPYLARNYVCSFCKQYQKIYFWRKEYRGSSMKQVLQKKFGEDNVGDVIDMKVARKDKAGLVKEIAIKTTRGSFRMTGADMYKHGQGIKSFAYTISVKNPASRRKRYVVIEGRGLGHHYGLCQWGAREMIKRGKDYSEIVSFYYPGTEVMLRKKE